MAGAISTYARCLAQKVCEAEEGMVSFRIRRASIKQDENLVEASLLTQRQATMRSRLAV